FFSSQDLSPSFDGRRYAFQPCCPRGALTFRTYSKNPRIYTSAYHMQMLQPTPRAHTATPLRDCDLSQTLPCAVNTKNRSPQDFPCSPVKLSPRSQLLHVPFVEALLL